MDEHGNKIWTYDDLSSLPDDGKRYEILDGALVVSPSPSRAHQRALKYLLTQLLAVLEVPRIAEVYAGPFDVIASPTRVLVPDLLAVRWNRRSIIKNRGVEGAPDLAIEVVSPSNAKHDRVVKRRMYARMGVREYWIVDPFDETIEVLELIEDGLSFRQAGWYGPGERVRSASLGFELDVDSIFRKDPDDY